MKIGIVAAMEEELNEFCRCMPDREEKSYRIFRYYSGVLRGHEVTLLLCGIGKVNAAVGTTILIEEYKPDYVINTGVAGGVPSDILRVGDVVISSEVRYHDADATIFDYEYGQIPRMPAAYYPDKGLKDILCRMEPPHEDIRIVEGQIISGDMFVHDKEHIAQIREKFPSVMAVEMEGAAIAQTCYLLDIPFIITRSISDLVDAEASHEVYKQSVHRTAEISVSLVLKLLEALNKE